MSEKESNFNNHRGKCTNFSKVGGNVNLLRNRGKCKLMYFAKIEGKLKKLE